MNASKSIPVPILMYHSVSAEAGSRFRKYAISPDNFARHMDFLRESGYSSITVSQFVEAITTSPVFLPKRPVVITFDDGYADFYVHALPAMERCDFTATLYVSTKFIGLTSEWLKDVRERHRPLLTVSQLVEIASRGIEIGAHGHHHRDLDVLSPGEAKFEITRSREILERELRRKVLTFAYPYGHYTEEVRHMVVKAGYTSACATKHALSTTSEDRFALSRIGVASDTDLPHFSALVEGHGLKCAPTHERARTTAWRLVRRSTTCLKRSIHAAPSHEPVSYEK